MAISFSFLTSLFQKRYPGTQLNLSFQPVGGGSINTTLNVKLRDKYCFCKVNSVKDFPMLFSYEQLGLETLGKHSIFKVPEIYDCFEEEDFQILLMEWIDPGERTPRFWQSFGQQLARLHSVSNTHFGLHHNNYMGSVPQLNSFSTNWNEFFSNQRLVPLIDKCLPNNLLSSKNVKQFEKLINYLPEIFGNHTAPSLLHGDLWSGNFICDKHSTPVLIDPAVYYGHPSVDLGMTTLFGGFSSDFYEAYQSVTPFPKNYEEQWAICNLYPLLIHLLLFGKSYLHAIESNLEKYY
ncbi:MAG TPA: fructosamine kinase family protein [Flavisolibacter sp.]|nr:fructosamine kinase family protein [Flavisolibacter sp.]